MRLYALLIALVPLAMTAQPPLAWAGQMDSKRPWSYKTVNDITLDRSHNLYTAGFFSDTLDFDPSPAVYTLASIVPANNPYQNENIYVTKISPAGNLIWVKQIASYHFQTVSIAVDSSENVFISGQLYGTVDFDPGPQTYTLGGTFETFILKLDASGQFQWVKKFNQWNGSSTAYDMAIDAQQNLYLAGMFTGHLDFDPNPASVSWSPYFQDDTPFLVKLTNNGTLAWGRNLGGHGQARCLTIRENQEVIFGGWVDAGVDLDPGSGTQLSTSTGEIFAGWH